MKMTPITHLYLGIAVIGTISVIGVGSARALGLYSITDLNDSPYEYTALAKINDIGQVVFESQIFGVSRTVLWQKGVRTDIGNLGGNSTIHYGISNTGQIVGASLAEDGRYHPFLWKNGTIEDLTGVPGVAYGINNAGQVVGLSYTPSGEGYSFLWKDGKITDLSFLGKANGFPNFEINNRGQVAGTAYNPDGSAYGFLLEDGKVTDLGNFGGPSSGVGDINDKGQIVGGAWASDFSPRAYLWENGTLTNLGTFGGESSSAEDINNAGQILVASGNFRENNRYFLWENGSVKPLGTLGGDFTTTYELNDLGQIIGRSTTADGQVLDFLWQDGKMSALIDLIKPNSGWEALYVTDINNKGQIVGGGLFNGQYRSFLMTPVPEPSSVLGSVLLGGMFLSMARRRLKGKKALVKTYI